MNITIKVVNTILSNKLYHRQFQRNTIRSRNSKYGGIVYFCPVLWLSRGLMLSRVYMLRNNIAFKSKNTNTTVCENKNCFSGRYGLTSQFNKPNLVLQRITS